MRATRLSIAWMMFLVCGLALLLTAIRYPSPFLGTVFYSSVVLSLILALIGLVYARRTDRVTAAGFLIAGGITYGLHFIPWLSDQYGKWLASSALADVLYEHVAMSNATDSKSTTGPPTGGGVGIMEVESSSAEWWLNVERPADTGQYLGGNWVGPRAADAMQRIVSSLAVLGSAFLGAITARWFAHRAQATSANSHNDGSTPP
jgi:hypothetical protein